MKGKWQRKTAIPSLDLIAAERKRYRWQKAYIKALRGTVSVLTYVAAVAALIVFLFQGHMYFKTVGAYQRGQYEVVEGYVENFDPMPYGGHTNESFEINDVYFEYSDYNVTSGYRNTKSHGGVITGDGQYLKIGYVYYNSTYGNIIVYIEELSPPS